uniref:Neur_chan_memb domain-containing protein n=1 Tax=Caenorhabditis tropicalis TaxID=1561998 RepID=A0A1I7TZL7_9PELO
MSKLNVGLTNIMTMTFILGVMSDKIPRTGSIPLLGIYIIVNLFIMLIAIFVVVLITEVRKRFIPILRKRKTSACQKLETFMGSPLEFTCATLLELATCANFIMMIGFWIDDTPKHQ